MTVAATNRPPRKVIILGLFRPLLKPPHGNEPNKAFTYCLPVAIGSVSKDWPPIFGFEAVSPTSTRATWLALMPKRALPR